MNINKVSRVKHWGRVLPPPPPATPGSYPYVNSVALMIGRRHFARFRNHHDPRAFVNMGVACELLRSDNRGVG